MDHKVMQANLKASEMLLEEGRSPHFVNRNRGSKNRKKVETKGGGRTLEQSAASENPGFHVQGSDSGYVFLPDHVGKLQKDKGMAMMMTTMMNGCSVGSPTKHHHHPPPPHRHHHHHDHDIHLQEFQYFVVIDFEATCDKDRNPHPQEIIEFPSVIVNSSTGQLESCFQTYVRPTCNRILTDFCKELTGIKQAQVEKGVLLGDALLKHDRWLEQTGVKNASFAVVTWSNWDCEVMLESECRYKKIRKPHYFNRWINLRVPFNQAFGGIRCNLKQAVEHSGLTWQGRPHCGLDDAKNTARLLLRLMTTSKILFSITNFLCPSSSSSPPPPPLSQHHHLRGISIGHHPAQQQQQQQQQQQVYWPHCFCGVRSSTGIVQKPGPRQGFFFFGCGNWPACCRYFRWASLPLLLQ